MIFSGICPVWFLGFDVLLELFFILITALIAGYAFKVYRLSGERRFLWQGVGFLSLSGAYAVTAFANYYLYARIVQTVASPVPGVIDVNWLHLFGHVAHAGLFLAGYLLLALVALRFDDTRLITLFGSLLVLLAFAIVLSDQGSLFNLAVILLLSHVLLYTWINRGVRKGRSPLKRFVLGGFLLVLLGQLNYLLLPFAGVAYVIGHFLELAGYSLLAISMLLIMKKK